MKTAQMQPRGLGNKNEDDETFLSLLLFSAKLLAT
jgi:hypothetical protein